MSGDRTRVVILGAGFGGIYAYLGLHKRFHGSGGVEITLVSDRDYFLFVVLIHEVATGSLSPLSILQSIRVLPHCCLERFVEGRVTSVDMDERVVSVEKHNFLDDSSSAVELHYDYLISALGSDTNFLGVPGAKEHCLTLKNLEDAKRIKNRIIDCFQYADETLTREEQERVLRFVIVGGGPTGVELAGETADYIHREMYKAFPRLQGRASIALIQSGERLVPQVEEWYQDKTRAILARKMDVEVILNRRVTEVTAEGLSLGDEFIASTNVIWTAGVKAASLDVRSEKQVEYERRTGRMKVSQYLQLLNYPEVFVIGDQAWIYDMEAGQPYPMRALFAVREGYTAAENIKRLTRNEQLQAFHWHDTGFILSLGKGGALAKGFRIRWSGPLAWWLYRTVYLFKIVGMRARLRTMLEWTLNVFSQRDVSRL